MRSAPKKLFKFLKNPNFLNISLDIPGGPRGPRGPWRVLEAPGNLCRSLEVPGGPWRFLEVLGDPWRPLEAPGVLSNDENYSTNECVISTSF